MTTSAGPPAGSSRFLECTFQRCDLTELRAPRARFSETSLYAVHGAGVDLAESSWSDCLVQGARLGAVAMYGAELRRVRFEGCKIEFLNLRGATLRDVEFVDCQLVEADFAEAKLTRVSFERLPAGVAGLHQGHLQGRRPDRGRPGRPARGRGTARGDDLRAAADRPGPALAAELGLSSPTSAA